MYNFSSADIQFLIGSFIAVLCGFLIGLERESRKKPAGVNTNILVCYGAMLFTMLSALMDSESTTRIAANIVTGIGFLGAGIILHHKGFVTGLTTAASIWFSAAIGMAIGFGWYFAAIVGTAISIAAPRIPHLHHGENGDEEAIPKKRRKAKV